MKTLDYILKLLSAYQPQGAFQTNRRVTMSKIFNNQPIPNELDNFGVYIFTETCPIRNEEVIVYVGKNGTLYQNGSMGNHSLKKRIMQGKMKSKWFEENDFKVYWFVTIEKGSLVNAKDIPSVVESEILRTYFDLERKLPKYNSTF